MKPHVYAVIPVFNRVHFTLTCIRLLKEQAYTPITIIVADGGSTDGTVAAVRDAHPDVVVLTSESELWWAGAMAAGIEHALRESRGEGDCLLMMNNDTEIPADYVATLVAASQCFEAAVGGLIVDSRDVTHVLDAGEYVCWSPYSFPLRTAVEPGERFRDDVDVLPGRGSLVPLRMIRAAGSVDAQRFPHYLADYEFFYRLKRHGFRLGVSYETRVGAHIEETGIVPQSGRASFRTVWRELFSRRSMTNVVDHWRFVGLHAPQGCRTGIRLRLIGRVVAHLGLRTPLRPLALPVYWLAMVPGALIGQIRAFRRLGEEARKRGVDVLCDCSILPRAIRGLAYLVACPGPVSEDDCRRFGLRAEDLVADGILRPLGPGGALTFATLKVDGRGDSEKLRRLIRAAWSPRRKIGRVLDRRRGRTGRAQQ
jgi:glycosyltransferase involved in cell wall biosynthesis